METIELIKQSKDLINAKFNPSIVGGELKVTIPTTNNVVTFYKEDNNETHLTSVYGFFKPNEINEYLKLLDSQYLWETVYAEKLISLIGKKITIRFNDFDNGSFSYSGILKDVIQFKNHYEMDCVRVKFNNDAGEFDFQIVFYQYSNDREALLLAGDNSDEVEVKVLN